MLARVGDEREGGIPEGSAGEGEALAFESFAGVAAEHDVDRGVVRGPVRGVRARKAPGGREADVARR